MDGLFIFAVAKSVPVLEKAIGMGHTFLLFAFVCLITALYVHYLVPETRGKSLEEIEEHYRTKSCDQTQKS